MHRLFVAIRPPALVRRHLLGLMGGISGVRWQTDDQLHITLRFIGEVDRHLGADIAAALGAIHHPPFSIALNGLGTFETRGQLRTLWAGVTPHEPLKALHKKVDQALGRVGVAQDRRSYMPHIALARLSRSSGPVTGLVEHAGGLSSPLFEVDDFALFESRLTPEGAHYTALETYWLG
jgi:RNA 2',3'-cyclic 3'-phosphodiesterase